MSSPAGLQYSQADFLARWMPNSTRAGVILNPSADLAGSLRATSATRSTQLQTDDSFSSSFAPLPASVDSSCLDVDGGVGSAGGGTAGNDRPNPGPPARCPDGNSLNEMTSQTQDLPLVMKLDQLKKWQQHMHEQLKAHQLEELFCLQEEHHKLLGIVNGAQCGTGESSEWDEETDHHIPDMRCSEITQRTCSLQQEIRFSAAGRQEQLFKSQDHDDEEEEGTCDSIEDKQQSVDIQHFPEHNNTATQPKDVVWREVDNKKQHEAANERPIRPGIGGQKQTFEELLEEQLRLEEQRLKFAQHQQKQDRVEAVQVPLKRPFLKRGEGLSRFNNNRNTSSQKVETKTGHHQPQGRVISRSNSAPAFIQKGSSNSVPQLPVQRKTAVLNKENQVRGLCLQDFRTESKAARTKVLGYHQIQNTEPEARQTKHQAKKQTGRKVGMSVQTLRNCSPNLHQNPVAKQVGPFGGSGKADNSAAKEKSSGSKKESAERRTASGTTGEVHLDSFEMSFQERLQRWECDRQQESMELGEFELLEQAAEELSFSSNSSFVMKVLQMDEQKWQAAVGLYKRRLSSTPVKSFPRGEPQGCGGVLHSDGFARENNSVESRVSAVKITSDALKNKVSTEDEDGIDSKEEDGCDSSDISSECDSEFGDKEVAIKGTASFPVTLGAPYDKRSYQEEDSFRDPASDVPHEEDEQSDSVPSCADESTLIQDRDSQQGSVVFDDDDTWNDLDDAPDGKFNNCRKFSSVSRAIVRETSPQEKILLRKVAVSKAVEPDKVLDPDPPPASQLMSRLFPSLKTKSQDAPLFPPPAAPESKKPEDETGQQVQSLQLRERLAELEVEIKRFKNENAVLAKLRQENEKQQEALRKEHLEFEKKKMEEIGKFEEYKKEENRKLLKERKLFEKHASAARAIPDKKEREEIQVFKQQVSSLQEELRRKESRWASTHSRLRQQIDSLRQENSSLRDEIQMLEKLRLGALKKSSVSAEKDVGTKDLPRTSEITNVPSTSKGVTFASPLDSRRTSGSPPQSSAARRNSKDGSQGAAGIKSSLRRSVGTGAPLSSSSSTLLSGKKTNEAPAAASRNQNNPKQEESEDSSVKLDPVPNQPESREAQEPQAPQEVVTHPDGKVENILASGDRLIMFPNGTRKEISADGLSVKVTFFNGDTKQITADQRVIYYYAEAQTTHITYPDGVEVLHFPNNQTEKHFPDGRKEITFPDQTVKNLFPDGREESVLTDGTVIQVNPDGTKEIHFNTGQKEIHTANYKRREYPDGTVKTVYTDGRQETRYPTGRIRVKDKDGNVILDNQM